MSNHKPIISGDPITTKHTAYEVYISQYRNTCTTSTLEVKQWHTHSVLKFY